MKAKASVAETILMLAAARGAEKSICPSEVARTLWPDEWRERMDDVRMEAFRLQEEGRVRITQGAENIDGKEAHGPIRIRICERDVP